MIDNIIKAVAATFTMGSKKPPNASKRPKAAFSLVLAAFLI
jgi:hypothetical protein